MEICWIHTDKEFNLIHASRALLQHFLLSAETLVGQYDETETEIKLNPNQTCTEPDPGSEGSFPTLVLKLKVVLLNSSLFRRRILNQCCCVGCQLQMWYRLPRSDRLWHDQEVVDEMCRRLGDGQLHQRAYQRCKWQAVQFLGFFWLLFMMMMIIIIITD